jgi:inhibitor of KinA sporulation pathway (predicted exonuclease)
LSDACQYLRQRYQTRQRTWASYGDYDRRQFERQCQRGKVPYPFGPTHLNVKNLYALCYSLEHEVRLAQALEHCGRTFDGTPHRGVDDAWNIAGLLILLLHGERRA